MDAVLLKTPYNVSFSRNPIPFAFAVTPYGDTERKQIIRLLVKVMVEKLAGTGVYEEVRSQVFFPDAEGLIQCDVSTIIDPYLEHYTPRPSLAAPVLCSRQSCRFKIAWLLEKDNAAVAYLSESAVYHCIKGGLSLEEWHPSEFFTRVVDTDKKALNFFAQDKVSATDLRFIYWQYPYNNTDPQTVTLQVKDSAGAVSDYPLSQTIPGALWAVFCAPISLTSIGLPFDAVAVAVKVTAGGNVVVAPVWKELEQRAAYNTHSLLYRGSTGALETLTLRGQVEYEADYARQSAARTLPPSAYKNTNLLSSQITAAAEQEKWKGDTGFVSKATIERLRDLLLSTELYAFKNGRLIPVVVASKSAKFYTNRDNLLSLQLEWAHAHSNENFTPAGLMPGSRSCPALEQFKVVQLNKKTLQIMYACPAPYDLCEVKLYIPNATVETYTFQGNTRVLRLQFDNPITAGTLDIELHGRVVCNPDLSPADRGPVTISQLTIYGNSPVVANADSFTIQNGFNTAVSLPGSVLDNDYDPDGDALTVLTSSGLTTKGGVFNITPQGVVSYTPPSSAFVGVDTFTYTVQEAGGTTAQGSVTIYVGTVASTVYAKAVKRNSSSSQSGVLTTETGQIWLEFYSDPAGTVPYDVTALNPTINYQKKKTGTGGWNSTANNTTENLTAAGAGTTVKIYDGLLSLTTGGGFAPGTLTTTFKTLPGTGYTAI